MEQQVLCDFTSPSEIIPDLGPSAIQVTIWFDQPRMKANSSAIFVPSRSCLLKGLLVLRLAHRVTCLTNSQARSCLLKGLLVLQPSATHRGTCLASYLSCKLTVPVLLAQGITGLAALSHSQSYLSCKLTAWSCCSRNYWSCSFSSLTGLPILQTHGLIVCWGWCDDTRWISYPVGNSIR